MPGKPSQFGGTYILANIQTINGTGLMRQLGVEIAIGKAIA